VVPRALDTSEEASLREPVRLHWFSRTRFRLGSGMVFSLRLTGKESRREVPRFLPLHWVEGTSVNLSKFRPLALARYPEVPNSRDRVGTWEPRRHSLFPSADSPRLDPEGEPSLITTRSVTLPERDLHCR
jgi:hypothetical protein